MPKYKAWFTDRKILPGIARPATLEGQLVALALVVYLAADAAIIGLTTLKGIVLAILAIVIYRAVARTHGANPAPKTTDKSVE